MASNKGSCRISLSASFAVQGERFFRRRTGSYPILLHDHYMVRRRLMAATAGAIMIHAPIVTTIAFT